MTDQSCRVLHVITRLDHGGSATNTIVSVDRLRKHGFDAGLVYGRTNDPDGTIGQRLRETGVPCVYMTRLVRNPSPLNDAIAFAQIRRLLKTVPYDIVHTHSSKAGILGRLAARSAGIPVIHTPHGHVFYGYFSRFTSRFYAALERYMARNTARIVSLTDIETRESLENGVGTAGQYVTIPSGVPLSRFSGIPAELGGKFRAGNGIPNDAVVLVSAGRLVGVKGFDMLIRAFGRAVCRRNLFLVIAGDGPEKAGLANLAVSLGISDRVRFAGLMPDIRPALSAADLFALASRNEGMGRAYVEAMAAGLPVIGTAVGGVPALVRHGRTGLLVPAEDVPALAGAIEELAGNRELRRSMGAEAARSVCPAYDEDTMIEKLAELYRQVRIGASS